MLECLISFVPVLNVAPGWHVNLSSVMKVKSDIKQDFSCIYLHHVKSGTSKSERKAVDYRHLSGDLVKVNALKNKF